ncbi:MAG: hypothetical protein KGR48_09805 [Alphaproteobacteria bacterium]|nr:hypothetical protein [Alphaproteobacteria bacterium]
MNTDCKIISITFDFAQKMGNVLIQFPGSSPPALVAINQLHMPMTGQETTSQLEAAAKHEAKEALRKAIEIL